ncbi:MAG: tetratricopeptide repeat protein [Nitrospirota bacterium]
MYKLLRNETSGGSLMVKLSIGILLFIAFLFSYLREPLWDYDFWWHIATGKYIINQGHLPEKDPFSFTSAMEENKNLFPEREKFILKQYWLAQILFFLVFDNTGSKGIIFMRSALLAMTVFLVYWRLRRWFVSIPVSYIFSVALFTVLRGSTGERPVLFTIFFTALTFFLLEVFKERKDWKIFLLLPIMLLWSNMHGGFILGLVVISVFMLGEGIKIVFKKDTYSRGEVFMFYSASIIAIAISFANPNGWDAFEISLSSKYKLFYMNIVEYRPLFYNFSQKISEFNYGLIFLFAIFPLILILRNQKIELTHIILLAGTLFMSIQSARFAVYYAIIAAMILGRESDILINNLFKRRLSEAFSIKAINILTIFAFISILIFIVGNSNFNNIKFQVANRSSVPESAVDFIEKNRISGNMFNDFGYGGYIAWRLYPGQKTFIDTRKLNITVDTEYRWIIMASISAKEINPSKNNTPLWERLLNHYKINFILLSALDHYGQMMPVVLELVESDKWVAVYSDPITVIFLKNDEKNKEIIEKFRLMKEDVYNAIIFSSSLNALYNNVNPRYLLSLGDVFYKIGRKEEALKAYRYALERMPNSPVIQEKFRNLESELKGNNL